MHCEKCVERITNALNAAGLSFEVSLNDKTVTVNGDDASAAKAAEALDDIGFEAQR
jgi:copper chaperone CopZ